MEDFFDIIKYTLPSLIVLGVAYFVIKGFFNKEIALKQEELNKKAVEHYLPLRVQAYERSILYLERIDPNNLIMRTHKPGMSAKYLHAELLKTIREEYAHNMAQQVHVSIKGWAALKQAKEETVKILNMAQNSMSDTANALELSSVIFEILAKLDKHPIEVAINVLKRDFQKSLKSA